jgi:hypothetical protein
MSYNSLQHEENLRNSTSFVALPHPASLRVARLRERENPLFQEVPNTLVMRAIKPEKRLRFAPAFGSDPRLVSDGNALPRALA